MLYDELSAVEKSYLGAGYFTNLAESHKFALDNLSENVKLRDYQKKAFGRYCFYMEQHKSKKYPIHLLFNMATGSGKTVIMAAVILDLYKRGYRNFIFFTPPLPSFIQ